MWMQLLCAVFATIFLLYVPGYLLFRGMRLSSLVALCVAPLASVCAYSVLPIVYYARGIPCNLATVGLPALALGMGAYAVARWKRRLGVDDLGPAPQDSVRLWGRTLGFDATMMLAYALCALVVCLCMFVFNLPHPDAFYSRFDNQTHLNLVQSFLDSGKWSTLHTSVYLASDPVATPAPSAGGGGFYPAAWHVLVALVCSATGASVAVATNAAVIAVCVTTIPLCLYLFMRALFPRNRLAVELGALVTNSAAVYPWVFVLKGPTWPDMLGNGLLPAVFAVVMLMVEQRQVARRKVAMALFAACSFVGIALIHPSSVFTAYVFFVPYGLHVIWTATHGMGRAKRAVLVCGYCVAVVAFWVLCYHVPLLQGILSYRHTDPKGVPRAVVKLALFAFGITNEQPLLTIGLLAGIVACIRQRRWWMLFMPAYFGMCYLLSHSNIEVLKYWFAALWYMTGYRFASRVVLFCLPLIAWGVQEMAQWLAGVLAKRLPAQSRVTPRMVLGIVLVVACALNYAPYAVYDRSHFFDAADDQSINHSAYGRVHARIHNIYADEMEHVYSSEEVAFVNEAMRLIPPGALVINSPRDGSMWAYAINHLNAYYRKQSPAEEATSVLLRKHLCDIAHNADVQDAVRQTGAQYVLLLDKDVSFEDGVWLDQFKEKYVKNWKGIESIDDDTPGFRVVLAKGDQMRLYQIEV